MNLIFYDDLNSERQNEAIVLNQFRDDFSQGQHLEKSLYFLVRAGHYRIDLVIKNPNCYDWKIGNISLNLESSIP